jgi:FKBP-type peptidyl-prolyl cis-trans isomerase
MEALPMMHVGDTWRLYVPANLGYGHREMGIIPKDSPLIFKIQLLGVAPGR